MTPFVKLLSRKVFKFTFQLTVEDSPSLEDGIISFVCYQEDGNLNRDKNGCIVSFICFLLCQ